MAAFVQYESIYHLNHCSVMTGRINIADCFVPMVWLNSFFHCLTKWASNKEQCYSFLFSLFNFKSKHRICDNFLVVIFLQITVLQRIPVVYDIDVHIVSRSDPFYLHDLRLRDIDVGSTRRIVLHTGIGIVNLVFSIWQMI